MKRASEVLSSIAAQDVRPMKGFDAKQYQGLNKIGINLNPRIVREMAQAANDRMGYAMDSVQGSVTTASIPVPAQFLQNWLPGVVEVITAARRIDDAIGIMTTGKWHDEQIVQTLLEKLASPQPYGDYTNSPLASWNLNYNARTVVRFEQGIQVGLLEAARSGEVRIDDSGTKRGAAANSLEILRNSIGFIGFNSGLNNTYGFLNDPGEGAYTTVPVGGAGQTVWSSKTFLEISKDILTAIVKLRTQSQDQVDPERVNLTLFVATNSVDWLATQSDFGTSVRKWLTDAYPRVRIISAPELNAANGGANVFYLYADRIQDTSTDGGEVFIQMVPSKFITLGVEQRVKGYRESFSNATAGVMCKRPYGMVRFSGI